MKRIILSLICLSAAIHTTNAQWSEVLLPRTDTLTPIVAVEWPDSNTGYVFDVRGYYYKTTNAGHSWIRDSLRPMPQNDISIQPYKGLTVRYADFITPQFGIVTLSVSVLPELDSVIYCTTDGGSNWKRNKMNLKNHSKWVSYTLQYSRIRMNAPSSWYMHYMMEDYEKWYGAELLLYSSDMGDNWKEISADTLGSKDIVSARTFITIDSLHHYKFYHWHHSEGDNSWVKMTTDGGRTWIRIQDPSHPLAEQYYRGFAFKKVHMVNDTGLSITMAPQSAFPPGRNYGITTRDIDYRDTKQGWTSFTLPWRGTATVDIAYMDGVMYVITSSATAPLGYTDSTWIVNYVNGRTIGLLSPTVLRDIYPSSKDMVWALGRRARSIKLYRLDKKLLSMEGPIAPLKTGSLKVYPNPININSQDALTIEYNFAHRAEYANITVHDLLGRQLMSVIERDIEPGRYSKTFSLRSLRGVSFPPCVIVTLSTNDLGPVSTMIIIAK